MQSIGNSSTVSGGSSRNGGCEVCCSRFTKNFLDLSMVSKIFLLIAIIILIIYMVLDVTNAVAIPLILLPPVSEYTIVYKEV